MSKEMIIASSRHETKIALTEEGQVVEVYIEREKEVGLAGSIYKGRVTRVLPGMQSAFVDIGLDRDAFLYVSDFSENLEGMDLAPAEDEAGEESEKSSSRSRKRGTGRRGRRSRSTRGKKDGGRQTKKDDPKSEEEGPANEAKADANEPDAPAVAEEATATDKDTPAPAAKETEAVEAEEPELTLPEERPRGRGRSRRSRPSRGGRSRPGANFRDRDQLRRPAPAKSEQTGPTIGLLPGESIAAFKDAPVPSASSRSDEDSPEASATPTPAEEPTVADAETAETVAAPAVALETEESRTDTDEPTASSDVQAEDAPPAESSEAADPDESVSNGYNEFPSEAISTETREELDDTLAEMERFRSYEDEVGLPPSLSERTGGGVMWQEEEEEEEGESAESAAEETEAETEEQESEIEGGDDSEEESLDAEPAADEGLAEGTEKDEEDKEKGRPSRRKRSRRRPAARTKKKLPKRAARRGGRSSARGGRSLARGRGPQRRRTSARPSLGQPAIADLLKAGQEIIVQIAKEQIGQKGARITSHITLPGRFLVYMPTISHIGVSRKIGTANERARLRRSLVEMKGEAGGGFVVRTAAADATDDELRTDVEYLVHLWREMVRSADKQKPPALLHRDLDLTQRLLRDQLSSAYETVWIDNEEEYTRIVEFVGQFLPKLSNKVKLYTREEPIFEEMGVQQEIDRALRPKVWLKSGGYIVINQTEALVAIDINTGKFVGKGSTRLEDTIVKTNIEAIKEIVRQIRLRDLGGIIVIDFIDMEDRRNRQKVMRELERGLDVDRQPSKILAFNDFGLVAITRKRSRQSLERVLCQPCPYCTGTGTLKSVQTLCIEIQAHARRMADEMDAPELTIRANPDIISALKDEASRLIRELEEESDKNIILQPDESLHFEHYNIY